MSLLCSKPSYLLVKSYDDPEGHTQSGPSPPLRIHLLTLSPLFTPPEPYCPLALSYTCQELSFRVVVLFWHIPVDCSSRYSSGLFLIPLVLCSNVTCISRAFPTLPNKITPCPQPRPTSLVPFFSIVFITPDMFTLTCLLILLSHKNANFTTAGIMSA